MSLPTTEQLVAQHGWEVDAAPATEGAAQRLEVRTERGELALLYVFEWLGYQEETLPMMREAPASYMQFGDQRPSSSPAGT